ncbi:MAG: branched-chain amino acid ABC transporter permease, partial [Beijerinckiaceae bacterium]
GSNGLVGLWPSPLFASKPAYYFLALSCAVMGVLVIRRILFSPFGYAMRASRDSVLRAEAIGIDVKRVQWIAFVISGLICGLAGAIFAFSKGSISPDTVSVGRSVDGLVMVLLGGVQSLIGPILGSAVFTWLQDTIMRETDYWRALMGAIVLAIVLLFPRGLAGALQSLGAFWTRKAVS